MTTDQAQSAVSLSAFVVAAIYGYRKLTETTTGGAITAAPVGHFVLGFGFVYVGLSIVAQAAPDFGGMMAVLVATGDVLANGNGLVKDVTSGLKSTAPAASSSSTAPAATVGATPGVYNTPGGGTATFQPPTNLPNPAP